ncbi:MAG TPA: hydantoinase/oxoprolinase N-terminal domain-containing protein [Ktedonobacteraceae bacterium]
MKIGRHLWLVGSVPYLSPVILRSLSLPASIMSEALVGIDTGGTFTDIILARAGVVRVLKIVSTPQDPARAIVEACVNSMSSTISRSSSVVQPWPPMPCWSAKAWPQD